MASSRLPKASQYSCPSVECAGVIGAQFKRSLYIRQSLGGLAQRKIGPRTVVVGKGVCRIDLDRLIIVGHGSVLVLGSLRSCQRRL